MRWHLSYRADPRARALADRHYSRQKIGAEQFVPPGRCLVLVLPDEKLGRSVAYWVTSWPFAEYVKHAWAGAWMCSAFRNEAQGVHLSSELIREAVAATRAYFGTPPPQGFVTFVDRDLTQKKRDPGRCYRRAGWVEVGETVGGLVALRQRAPRDDDYDPLRPKEEWMPEPREPIGFQRSLFGAAS